LSGAGVNTSTYCRRRGHNSLRDGIVFEMDEHLRALLHALLEADPDTTLDDNSRQAVMYAMLGLHPSEHTAALCRFAQSIESEFKRSHLLHKLASHSAQHIQFDLAEQIARCIPEPYWRFSALNAVAAELLRRDREAASINVRNTRLHEWAIRLLEEIERGLPSIPEDDGDRATVLWRAGLSLIDAGKLEWAEDLASTESYCPENTEVLLNCAKVRASRDQSHRAVELAKTVGRLAATGTGQEINRTYDLADVAQLMFNCGAKDEARKYLEEAARFAFASQEAHDIDGCKSMVAIAIKCAKQGHVELAQKTANKITQPARRQYALQEIAKLTECRP
jgi:hypothetical protein